MGLKVLRYCRLGKNEQNKDKSRPDNFVFFWVKRVRGGCPTGYYCDCLQGHKTKKI